MFQADACLQGGVSVLMTAWLSAPIAMGVKCVAVGVQALVEVSVQALVGVSVHALVEVSVQVVVEVGVKASAGGEVGSLLRRHEAVVAGGSEGTAVVCAAVATYDLDSHWMTVN